MPKKKAATRKSTTRRTTRGKKTRRTPPTAADYDIANTILRGATQREAAELHGVARSTIARSVRRVEDHEKGEMIDDRLRLKRQSTRRLYRSLLMVTTQIEAQFADFIQARESGVRERIADESGIDPRLTKEAREIDVRLCDLWGVGPATVPDDGPANQAGLMSPDEYREDEQSKRRSWERSRRMLAEMGRPE
jgi:hypothetical protein